MITLTPLFPKRNILEKVKESIYHLTLGLQYKYRLCCIAEFLYDDWNDIPSALTKWQKYGYVLTTYIMYPNRQVPCENCIEKYKTTHNIKKENELFLETNKKKYNIEMNIKYPTK